MATPTNDPTKETCGGDASESDPTMETNIGVLSDATTVSKKHHMCVTSANFSRVPGAPKAPARIKRGPWGGNGGTLKEMEGKSQRLESLTIYHHGVVEGFQFTYTDDERQIRTAGPWGQNRNLFIQEVSKISHFITTMHACVRVCSGGFASHVGRSRAEILDDTSDS
jgi:hypothetical protein